MSVNSGGRPPDIGDLSVTAAAVTSSVMILNDNTIADPIDTTHISIPNNNPTQIIGTNNANDENDTNKNKFQKQRMVYKYEPTDTGPFHVYIENTLESFKGRLNAIKVGDIVLSNYPELDNKIKIIEAVGRNRIKIDLKDYKSANYLLKDSILKKFNLEAYIPQFLMFRKGVLRHISSDYSEEHIKSKIQALDFHCKFTVHEVKRILRKANKEDGSTQLIPTQSVIVTFKSQSLPKYVTINRVVTQVEPYIQKVLMCYNCFRYGHIGKQCKSASRCLKCGDKHTSEGCNANVSPKCLHCQGSHLCTKFSDCPEFQRQKQIKTLMSLQNLTYYESIKQVPKNTYAMITANKANAPMVPFNHNPEFTSPNQNVTRSLPSKINTNTTNKPNRAPSTETRTPFKRSRPDLTQITHRNIVTPVKLPSSQEGILLKPSYRSHLPPISAMETEAACASPLCPSQTIVKDTTNINLIFEVVQSILQILQQSKTLDITQDELIKIIKNKLQASEQGLETSINPYEY